MLMCEKSDTIVGNPPMDSFLLFRRVGGSVMRACLLMKSQLVDNVTQGLANIH
jgi:hypothetical protein